MQAIAIALVGLFAFTGTPGAAADVASAPANEYSAKLAVETAPSMEMVAEAPVFNVKLTSYNAVPEQTDHNPSVTASGAPSNHEVVAARSVDLKGDLPFGTIVAITREGSDTENCRFGAVEHLVGYRVIADSMHSRKRNQIDVLLHQADTVRVHGKETNPAVALGYCTDVTIRVIGKIDIKDMPSSQEELRMIVEGERFALR